MHQISIGSKTMYLGSTNYIRNILYLVNIQQRKLK